MGDVTVVKEVEKVGGLITAPPFHAAVVSLNKTLKTKSYLGNKSVYVSVTVSMKHQMHSTDVFECEAVL